MPPKKGRRPGPTDVPPKPKKGPKLKKPPKGGDPTYRRGR